MPDMPPSLRRRARHEQLSPQHPDFSDSDEVNESQVGHEDDSGDEMEDDDLDVMEGDEDLEDEDEEGLASPGEADADAETAHLPYSDPPPPYFREISSLASWTVSSSKPGCSVPQLRHPSPSLFWQSDGPQPHLLNIHFNKLVRIVGLRLYLDFDQDESYTPTRIAFLAGSGMNDLQEWGEMRLETPRGWIWADFSNVSDVETDGEDDDNDPPSFLTATNPPHHRQHQHQPRVQPPIFTPEAFTPSHLNTSQLLDDSSDMDPEDSMMQMDAPPPRRNPRLPTTHIDTPPTRPTAQTHLRPPQPHPHGQTHSFTSPTTPDFASRSTPAAIAIPHPPSPRRPRLPILRAHLLQVKIMENHQNGKDTHLRAVQVFARNDEGIRVVEAQQQQQQSVMAAAAAKGRKKSKRESIYELGGGAGLGRGAINMEPSIR